MQLKIEYKELPKNILFIYTEIFNTKYGIINTKLSSYDLDLMRDICLFLFENNASNRIVHTDSIFDPEEMESLKDYLKKLGKNISTFPSEKIHAFLQT